MVNWLAIRMDVKLKLLLYSNCYDSDASIINIHKNEYWLNFSEIQFPKIEDSLEFSVKI